MSHLTIAGAAFALAACVAPLNSPLLAQELPNVPAPQQPNAPPAAIPGDWNARDLDAKWVYLQQDLEAHRADTQRFARWVSLLAAAKDFDFLAELATWTSWSQGVGSALVANKDPRWMALAAWNLGSFDSHNKDTALSVVGVNQALFLGWLKRFPAARVGLAATLAKRYEEEGVEPADASALEPPLDPAQVLEPWLQARGAWIEMPVDQLQAKPGASYLHRTTRALHASANIGRATPYIIGRIVQLAGDERPTLRKTAHNVLAGMPPHLIPLLPLLRRAQDPKLDPGLRRLAFLTASHSNHPRAYWELWSALLGSDELLAEVAAERLAGIGGRAEREILEGVTSDRAGWEEDLRKMQLQINERIIQSTQRLEQGVLTQSIRAIERLVWIEHLTPATSPLRADLSSESALLREYLIDGAAGSKRGLEKVVLDHAKAEFSRKPPSWLKGDAATAAQAEFLNFIGVLRKDKGP